MLWTHWQRFRQSRFHHTDFRPQLLRRKSVGQKLGECRRDILVELVGECLEIFLGEHRGKSEACTYSETSRDVSHSNGVQVARTGSFSVRRGDDDADKSAIGIDDGAPRRAFLRHGASPDRKKVRRFLSEGEDFSNRNYRRNGEKVSLN